MSFQLCPYSKIYLFSRTKVSWGVLRTPEYLGRAFLPPDSLFAPGCETKQSILTHHGSRLTALTVFIRFTLEALTITIKMDDSLSSNFYSSYQLKQLQFGNEQKQEYQHPTLSIRSVMTAYGQDHRVDHSDTSKRQTPDRMQNPTNTELCRMMDDCKMETDIPTYHFYPCVITPEQTDKVKSCSWDKHDSMHTTTRRNNRVCDDEARLWNNLESIHSTKVLSRSGSRCGADSSSQSLSSSINEQEMLQGSNSDYNDSMCSFASFGETSFSDSIDTVTPSLQVASKNFTRSFDVARSNSERSLPVRLPRQPMMQRGASYRNCGNSLSQIQETSMDL